jgi:histidinol-phosphate aminotransferase
MIHIPQHIRSLKTYEPGDPVERIKERYGHERMAVLWNSESCFGMSPKAREALEKNIEASFSYPDPLATEARERIAEHLGKKKENVVLGNASEGVLYNIFTAFCSEGEELLSCEGTFVIAYIWATIHNITGIRAPMTKDHRFDLDALLERIDQRTKVIYIANSNNPTGTMLGRKELKEFLDQVPEEVLVVVDEAYHEFASELSEDFPDTAREEEFDRPNLITLRSLSKAYGLAGVRTGFAVGPEELIDPLLRVKLIFEPSHLAQVAAPAAFDDEEFLTKVLKNNREGLDYYYKELARLGVKFHRSYTNFLMLEMDSADQAELLSQKLMERGVLVRPLEDNRAFIENLEALLPELPG